MLNILKQLKSSLFEDSKNIMEQAARVKEIKHLHRKRTLKCLFSKIRLKNGQEDGQRKYLWSKSIL